MREKFKRFSAFTLIPNKATDGSACYDIYSAKCETLEPGVTKSIETDIGMKFSKK